MSRESDAARNYLDVCGMVERLMRNKIETPATGTSAATVRRGPDGRVRVYQGDVLMLSTCFMDVAERFAAALNDEVTS